MGWDLKQLLVDGFTGVAGKITSKPAKHLRAAMGQMVNFLFSLQLESAGAQAFSNVDTLLAPFIKLDGTTREEIKFCIRETLFGLCVTTRSGGQSPFTNFSFDLTVPDSLKSESVIIGGKPHQSLTYADCQAEMDLFNEVFFECMVEGDGAGRLFTFPLPTYNITEEFDWDKFPGLWEMTAKYGVPTFSNFIGTGISPSDVRSMCCRLRLDNKELDRRGGGLFGANPLTGSIGVVTVNLPRLGYKAMDEGDFFAELVRVMDLARDSLEIKRSTIEKYTEEDLYPYTKFYLRDIKAKMGKTWANHFSTIGIVGMHEACLNLLGKGIETKEGQAFAVRTLRFMRKRLEVYQADTGNLYNLEATPAEGTSYRLAKLDKKHYPDMVPSDIYTNSTHLPVGIGMGVFDLLEHQEPLQVLYTGGTVVHIYLGESPTPTAVKKFVREVSNKYKIPHFTITPTFSICPTHGYIKGEHHSCPECGSPSEVYSRVVGYLRPVSQWNDGKQVEFANRTTYKVE
jgi:ribonucleoside-triphosphate reductase